MRGLLNIAAFRSLIVGFVACQFGSWVQSSSDKRLKFCVIGDAIEDSGEAGVLSGWFITPSLCKTIDDDIGLTDGGDPATVLGDSAVNK